MNTNYFNCENCGKQVVTNGPIGTKNRNHCPFCLYSKHVDLNISGDRKESCQSLMKPIALTFKNEGIDKYGKKKQGEVMIVHQCMKCYDISINRIASDDDNQEIMKLYDKSKTDLNIDKFLKKDNIQILKPADAEELKKQLFGKN